VTDLFLNSHLNPIVEYFAYVFSKDHYMKLATFKPLDGASNTVALCRLFYTKQRHQHILVNCYWQLGLLIIEGIQVSVMQKRIFQHNLNKYFIINNISYAFELKHGGLQNIGDYLT
jgi:hypothetical protein